MNPEDVVNTQLVAARGPEAVKEMKPADVTHAKGVIDEHGIAKFDAATKTTQQPYDRKIVDGNIETIDMDKRYKEMVTKAHEEVAANFKKHTDELTNSSSFDKILNGLNIPKGITTNLGENGYNIGMDEVKLSQVARNSDTTKEKFQTKVESKGTNEVGA